MKYGISSFSRLFENRWLGLSFSNSIFLNFQKISGWLLPLAQSVHTQSNHTTPTYTDPPTTAS
jgi:hypothetical protein